MQIHIKWRYECSLYVNMDTASHVGQEIYTEPIYVHKKDMIKIQEVWQVYKSLQTNVEQQLSPLSQTCCFSILLQCTGVLSACVFLGISFITLGERVGRKLTSINPFFSDRFKAHSANGQTLNFLGITYLVGKIKFKLFFSGSIG